MKSNIKNSFSKQTVLSVLFILYVTTTSQAQNLLSNSNFTLTNCVQSSAQCTYNPNCASPWNTLLGTAEVITTNNENCAIIYCDHVIESQNNVLSLNVDSDPSNRQSFYQLLENDYVYPTQKLKIKLNYFNPCTEAYLHVFATEDIDNMTNLNTTRIAFSGTVNQSIKLFNYEDWANLTRDGEVLVNIQNGNTAPRYKYIVFYIGTSSVNFDDVEEEELYKAPTLSQIPYGKVFFKNIELEKCTFSCSYDFSSSMGSSGYTIGAGIYTSSDCNEQLYIWDFGDNSPQPITFYGWGSHYYPSAGVYNVRLTMINNEGCILQDGDANYQVPHYSAKRNDDEKPVIHNTKTSISPNPASSSIIVTSKDNIESIKIVDISGKTVYASNGEMLNLVNTISIEHLKSGLYFVKLKLENGTLISEKLIKI